MIGADRFDQRKSPGNAMVDQHSRLDEDDTLLKLRPSCECCDRDLPPAARDPMICSFECIFCADCTQAPFKGACPNCGGELVRRPVRPASKLEKDPASRERVPKLHPGCAAG